ncbi:hypothetical protein EHQ27_18755 [Leptospira wolffii]|uniref:hypothetical protein n=1 Tax=Leptospira wolffii TaxID=409998 RepID=UPI00108254F4|nr:hypothetical protein [Leptospira wolffii]TGK62593.1 hypothetical protein EHQ32_07195 [Leptospira wolffii]TGK65568.1 hypothetical protein EHQ27_18755 [Leptospira wolffii]TGK74022.1 hypothetical protein EHQ35_06575 [Leptospira wolffii]TGL28881.1 hypothetical protein EHQ57_13095 [Leptospira wolffii]
MLWEREHSFQKAAYCYDTFQCNANGRLSVLYWARLRLPFFLDLHSDQRLDSKLRTLHWKAETDTIHNLLSRASEYAFREIEEQFWFEEELDSDYYFELVTEDRSLRLRAKGLPESLSGLYNEIRNTIVSTGENLKSEPIYTDPKLIFSSQKHFLFNPKMKCFSKDGSIVVPADRKPE